MPSVNNPGTYSSVCIDLNVRNLAVNTILASALSTMPKARPRSRSTRHPRTTRTAP